MNRNRLIKGTACLLLAVLLFNFLFWEQAGLGINVSLFILALMVLMFALNPKRPNRYQLISAGGTIVSSIVFMIQGNDMALVMAILGFTAHVAMYHESRLRSLVSVLPQVVMSAVRMPSAAKEVIGSVPVGVGKVPRSLTWLKVGIVPVLIVAVFVGIYREANSKFDQLTAGFFDGFGEFFIDMLSSVFTAHTLFILLGGIIAAVALFRMAPEFMSSIEAQYRDRMERIRKKRPNWMQSQSMHGLERERRAGLILLVLMNALLLVVNVVDISWIWVGFEVPEGFDLKQFVHEGTWLLILSIILSIVILLFLFRGNQNFHPKRRLLQVLALAWVAQNCVLAISVFLRNYEYITFHGLATKRIGVIIFLTMVFFGLVTMALKIKQRRTGFNMIALNTWAAFVILTLAGTVDWDMVVVRTNLHHDNPAEIDVDHYLQLDPRTYPLIYERLDLVQRQMEKHKNNDVRWIHYQDIATFKGELDRKTELFRASYLERGRWAKSMEERSTFEALERG